MRRSCDMCIKFRLRQLHCSEFMGPRSITAERMFEETNAPELSLGLELFLFVTVSTDEQETRRPGPEGRKCKRTLE